MRHVNHTTRVPRHHDLGHLSRANFALWVVTVQGLSNQHWGFDMNIESTAKQPNLLLESAAVPLDLYIQFQFRKHRQKSFQDSVSIQGNIRSDHT